MVILKNNKKYSVITLLFVIALSSSQYQTLAQNCPANIDFEDGNFNGWICYTGSVSAGGGVNTISLTPSNGPVYNRHTMYSTFPGDGVDQYGGFPVNCPNGSGHSIRLGNNSAGTEAEGVSYEFTIPANQNVYSIIYNYAVVFQDPAHQPYEQPRMETEITNLSDNSIISCSSFTFYPIGSPLPGFELSPNPGSSTPVWYKNWTAVSVNLNGNAGKTIRLFFKTADCTFRRHFGYAYIDVNSECSGSFPGAAFCPDDSVVRVTAPYGYQSYKWFNSTFTQVLGNQQILTLSPPPSTTTILAVELVPYSGYGCLDTLFTILMDTLTVVANAGRDTFSCNHNPVPIGGPPKTGLVYHWSPAAGLSNPDIANPYASPDTATTYVITTNHDGGGCVHTDTVRVGGGVIDNSLQLLGSDNYCIGSGDSSVLIVQPSDIIQWYKDNVLIPGANQQTYRVTQSGSYYAKLTSIAGCTLSTVSRQINIATVPVPGFSINSGTQCLVNNKFIFTNTSTNVMGAMQYRWILGDGAERTTRNVTHAYTKAGTYEVKMLVSANNICIDSSSAIIRVNNNPEADFSINAACINLPVNVINNTIDTISNFPVNFLWDFGNGNRTSLKNPPAQFYNVPGSYIVSLSASTAQCPFPISIVKHYAVIDKPKPGINNSPQIAVIDLPQTLHARFFGDSILWKPGKYLNATSSYTPVFTGSANQLYNIEIRTKTGCLTVDTLLVKVAKNIEIYVPNAFTPNSDGINDFLRPVAYGIKEIRFFRVFNRWGQLFYEMHSDLPGWNGIFKGQAQASQTVVWMIEAIGADGKTYAKKGTSVLLR
jgi:gliding motility-associated-like protein